MQDRKTHPTYLTVLEFSFDTFGKNKLTIHDIQPEEVVKAIQNFNYSWNTDLDNLDPAEASKYLNGLKPIKENRIHVVLEYSKEEEGKFLIHWVGYSGGKHLLQNAIEFEEKEVLAEDERNEGLVEDQEALEQLERKEIEQEEKKALEQLQKRKEKKREEKKLSGEKEYGEKEAAAPDQKNIPIEESSVPPKSAPITRRQNAARGLSNRVSTEGYRPRPLNIISASGSSFEGLKDIKKDIKNKITRSLSEVSGMWRKQENPEPSQTNKNKKISENNPTKKKQK